MFYKVNGEMLECRSLARVKLSEETIDALNSTIVTSGGGGL